MENPYRNAMSGIQEKMALQSIRKVIRDGNINDTAKLNIIISIVNDFREDKEQAEETAERREEDEYQEKERSEQIGEMFDRLAAPIKNLSIHGGGSK